MSLVSLVLLAAGAATLFWFWRNPRCPRCRARRWDHRIVRPLMLCRGCATRVDRALRTYN